MVKNKIKKMITIGMFLHSYMMCGQEMALLSSVQSNVHVSLPVSMPLSHAQKDAIEKMVADAEKLPEIDYRQAVIKKLKEVVTVVLVWGKRFIDWLLIRVQ